MTVSNRKLKTHEKSIQDKHDKRKLRPICFTIGVINVVLKLSRKRLSGASPIQPYTETSPAHHSFQFILIPTKSTGAHGAMDRDRCIRSSPGYK